VLGAACLVVGPDGRVAAVDGRAGSLLHADAVGRPAGEALPRDLAAAVDAALDGARGAGASDALGGVHAEALPVEGGGCVVLLRPGGAGDGAALRHAEAVRDESQRLARALLVTIPDIVYLFDISAGRNVWFNREVAEVTGYSADEMRAMGAGINALVHPEDLARWPAFVAERDGLPDGAFAAFEYRVRHRDGRWRSLSARETVFARDADGRPTHAFGVAQDVSDQKEAERVLAERAEHQARIAEALQRPLLRTAGAAGGGGLRLFSAYRPASDEARVGGDFFDIVPLGAGRTALVVGDVMGKGLEAATGTAQAKFMLRTLLLEGHPPAEALARLNGYLYQDGLGTPAALPDKPGLVETPFVAVAVAVVDAPAASARFAVAGAEAPLVARPDGSVEPVGCGGLPLGVLPDWEQGGPAGPVALGSGGTVALFTDGLTEARDAAGEPFTADRVRAALAEVAPRPPEVIGRALVERARAWSGGVRHDDACLLVAQVPPRSPRSSVVVRRV
jgi:PAS domain S-box-containing protein